MLLTPPKHCKRVAAEVQDRVDGGGKLVDLVKVRYGVAVMAVLVSTVERRYVVSGAVSEAAVANPCLFSSAVSILSGKDGLQQEFSTRMVVCLATPPLLVLESVEAEGWVDKVCGLLCPPVMEAVDAVILGGADRLMSKLMRRRLSAVSPSVGLRSPS